MADRKISDLTALTAQASGDLIPIVDVSEAAAADKNKSITVEELFRDIPVNVGIGSNSPQKDLVVSDGGAQGIEFAAAESGTSRMLAYNRSTSAYAPLQIESSTLQLITGSGTNALHIDSSQRVGIGGNPSTKLHIHAGGVLRLDNAGGTRKTQIFNDATFSEWNSDTDPIRINAAHSSGYIRFDANSAERARMESSGRLLVGISSYPQNVRAAFKGNGGSSTGSGNIALLRQYSAISGNNLNASIAQIRFGDDNQNGDGAHITADIDGTSWSTTSKPTRLVFGTTPSGSTTPVERMRITSSGLFKFSNTGAYGNIDTNAHGFRQGTAGNWVLELVHSASSGSIYGLHTEFSAQDPNDANSWFLHGTGSGTNRFALYSNGGLANYQANNVNLCDEREKKNIEALDSTWGCLKNWDLKKFHYNEDADTDDKRYGVIAQQVAEHCPEVISDWVKQKAKDAVLDDDGNVVTPAVEEVTRMAVKEQQMMWMAIKALQEAQTRIETLEAKVAALEAG